MSEDILETDSSQIAGSAGFFLFDWIPSLDLVDIVRMSEQNYRESPWLDSRIRTQGGKPQRLPFSRIEPLFEQPPARLASMIFHIGHCGSTLLSRVLAISPNVLPLREPRPLRTLAAAFSELDEPTRFHDREGWNTAARVLMHSYGRVFSEGQAALVKATSTCNNLIGPLLEQVLLDRAILLYQPLGSHLPTVLRSGVPNSDLRGLAVPRMRQWMAIPGAPRQYISDMSLWQLAVFAWLGGMYRLLEARDRYPEHCRLLDLESLLGQTEDTVADVSHWLGLAAETDVLLAGLPELMSRNAKLPGEAFSPDERRLRHAAIRDKKREEIDAAMAWARELTESVPAFAACREFLE